MKTKYVAVSVIIILLMILSNCATPPVIKDILRTRNIYTYDQWKIAFNSKSFQSPSQDAYRKNIYTINLQKILQQNSDPKATYQMETNRFAIFTEEQFSNMFVSGLFTGFGKKTVLNKQQRGSKTNTSIIEIDWTTKGGVSSVKNQGRCGSCWAFSALAVLESYSLIFKQITVDLSQQQLVDCSSSDPYRNYGCNGGIPSAALNYVKTNGIALQSQYNYTGINQECKFNGGSFKISSILYPNGCIALQTAIATNTVSVAVDASNWAFYSSGVMNNCRSQLNHAVQLVGVVSTNWKIKNSWGAKWGESGYMRIAPGNTCGICNSYAVYAN